MPTMIQAFWHGGREDNYSQSCGRARRGAGFTKLLLWGLIMPNRPGLQFRYNVFACVILAAAEHACAELAQSGLSVTLTAVAAHAGIGHAMLYRYPRGASSSLYRYPRGASSSRPPPPRRLGGF